MSSHQSTSAARATPPFPVRQLFILALCRICEPIAFMSIFPYVYYMISSFKITSDESRIAIYAGMVTSAFTLAEFSTGVLWGRLSDKLGRKPVLLTGLAGTGLSMLLFGFARSLPVAMLARALGGLLNGNIGVLQTTVAEMVTVKEHQPRAYAVMPFIWCLGSIIGPAMGGALADPCRSYPSVFPRGSIFDRFPYLLPNLICTIVLACGVTIGILFLEETHEEKRCRRDIGLEVGEWILRKFSRTSRSVELPSKGGDANIEDHRALLEEDDCPPGYRSPEGSPRPSSSRVPLGAFSRASTQKAFTKQVVLNIVGYGILAYHTICFDQLMPVMLSSPDSQGPISLPFRFIGGFALSTKTIGVIMSFQGVYSMIAQVLLFPIVVGRFGNLAVFRFVALSYPFLHFAVPYLVLLPDRLRMLGLAMCLLVKITAGVLAYPSNAILLTNSAPSMLVLGTINGVAASAASLSRAFGPTVSGLIHSAGLRVGYSGLAWWSSAVVSIIGAIESLWIAETCGRFDLNEDIPDEESTLWDEPGTVDDLLTTSTRTSISESGEETNERVTRKRSPSLIRPDKMEQVII